MDAIFTNSKNSKSTNYHWLLLNLSDKINLERRYIFVALSNQTLTIHGQIQKKSYKNNKFKISAPTWNKKFELPDGSYSVSDILDYFKYILKKRETKTDNSPTRIYVNKRENRITFETKTGYYLEL